MIAGQSKGLISVCQDRILVEGSAPCKYKLRLHKLGSDSLNVLLIEDSQNMCRKGRLRDLRYFNT